MEDVADASVGPPEAVVAARDYGAGGLQPVYTGGGSRGRLRAGATIEGKG